MRNDPELGLPDAIDRAKLSKLVGVWKRIRNTVFPHEADQNDSRFHSLLNGTKGKGKRRAMNKVFRGALHLIVGKIEPSIPFLCSQTVLDLLCYWESNKSFHKFGETHIVYAGELTPHELSQGLLERYNDWTSSGNIPFRSVLNRPLADAKKAQRQQPQLEPGEGRINNSRVRYDEDDETLEDQDKDPTEILPKARRKKRKKLSHRNSQKSKRKVREISHQSAGPIFPIAEKQELVSSEQVHRENDEGKQTGTNSLTGSKREQNDTLAIDRDEVRTRVRPKQIAAQLPPIAQASEAPVLLEESKKDATKKPQIAPNTVNETEQPALSENIHQIFPPTANQKQGQNKDPQMAHATSLEVVDNLEKTFADVTGAKEEEI